MKKILIVTNGSSHEPLLYAAASMCRASAKLACHAASFLEEIAINDYQLVLFQLDESDQNHISNISNFIKGTFPNAKLVFFAGTLKGAPLPSKTEFDGFIEKDASAADYHKVISHILNESNCD